MDNYIRLSYEFFFIDSSNNNACITQLSIGIRKLLIVLLKFL